MKKVLAIVSAFALVGIAAFAEDAVVKFSGAVETGIQIQKSNYDGDDGNVQLWDDDSGSAGRFDLNGSYVNGNAGVEFKLRYDGYFDDATTDILAHSNLQGWLTLFDGKVKLVGGNLDTDAWKTDADDNFTSENGAGMQIQIMPIEGLNFGVKFNTSTPVTIGGDDYYVTPKQFFNSTGFGVKYATDAFMICGGYTLASDFTTDKNTALVDSDGNVTNGDDDAAWAYFGLDYTGVENLKILTEGRFNHLGDTDKKAADAYLNEFNEIIEYQVNDALDAGIVCYQWMNGSKDDDVDGVESTAFSFKPYVDYKVNDMLTASAEIGYAMNEDVEGNLFGKDTTYLWVKPSVVYNVSPKTELHVWYQLGVNDLSDDTAVGKGIINTGFVGIRAFF
ncbi:MAG: hypothetical protein LKF96_07720 [Treponema sp.]|jgi:hypothetical protein|nr:hypothetical protein [Treponema sp.]